MLARRGLLMGLGAALAAPAIIRTSGLLMPVRPAKLVTANFGIAAGEVRAEQIAVGSILAEKISLGTGRLMIGGRLVSVGSISFSTLARETLASSLR